MAVGAIWWFTGGSGTSALTQDPGIPPPDYVYLDNARVVSYLGQIEGGLSEKETQTEQLTQNRNAGVAASGFQIGGSSGQSSTLERVVTPNASARFYRLLDRLRAHDYLRTIDASAPPEALVRAFGTVPEGTFVTLRNCRLRLPTYVQLEQLLRTSKGRVSADEALQEAQQARPPLAQNAMMFALVAAGRIKGFGIVGEPSVVMSKAQRAQIVAAKHQLAVAARKFVRTVGPGARVPLSTCNGKASGRPRGVDLLVPIRLNQLSPEKSLLAGPVTVVGKIVRAVRRPADAYVDDASLALFDGPVTAVDEASSGTLTESSGALLRELDADVTVLSPGAVILPIAIYK